MFAARRWISDYGIEHDDTGKENMTEFLIT